MNWRQLTKMRANHGSLPNSTRLEAANGKAVLVSWGGPKERSSRRSEESLRPRTYAREIVGREAEMFVMVNRVNRNEAR